MSQHIHAVAGQLLLIERELRVLQWWSDEQPESWRLQSASPFCVDTLELQEWLQWIFLPRMKLIIEQQLPLPGKCGILPVAELSWKREERARIAALLAAIAEMDYLLGGQD